MEETDTIKDYVFEYINKKDEIKELVAQQKFQEVIDYLIMHCYDDVIRLGKKEKAVGIFATSILHYILTCALIPSQRKVEKERVEIDIVIPDLKTLEKDPKMSLIIYIPNTIMKEEILAKLTQLQEIQYEKQNIWIVLSKEIDLGFKTYVLSKENPSFSKIIYDIAQFMNVNKQNKFRILKT